MRKIAMAMAFVAATGFACSRSEAQFPAAPGTGPGLAETVEAIDSARVTTRILYVTAHPDDESAAVLTYLARGLHADVALLSLTRGEGGQNALGPEQAPQLGLIRTQELLAATRGYGVKLYFTRAKDFGFCKTPEEAEKVWGDQVLEDMVRVIRTFRPNIVINGWGGVHQGHGHHQAAGLLTPIAVERAGDATAYPDQAKEELFPWGGATNEVVILDLDRFSEKPAGYVLPLDEVSPLWGKSWREMGIDAFANHRTQGVAVFYGNPFFRRPIALKREDGKTLDGHILAQPLGKLFGGLESPGCKKRNEFCESLAVADQKILEARTDALKLDWSGATRLLRDAGKEIARWEPGDIHIIMEGKVARDEGASEAQLVHHRILEAQLKSAGISFTADAERGELLRNEPTTMKIAVHCREGVECPVQLPPGCIAGGRVTESRATGKTDSYECTFLAEKGSQNDDSRNQISPEPAPLAFASFRIGGDSMPLWLYEVPATHVTASSTHVERTQVRMVPAYTVAVEPKQTLELVGGERKNFDVFLRIHSYSTRALKVAVGMDVPANWVYNGPVDVSFTGEGDRYAKFTVTPPAGLAAGNYPLKAFVMAEGASFTTSIEPLPSMPTLVWEEPAQTVVHAFDIKVPQNLRVGYISAESEPVPDALKMLGIGVDMLDANAVNFGDLSKYDAIVVGVRAYELRGELPGANQRLLDYAKNGGTLLVQYQRDFAWDGRNYAPYPAKIASKPGEPLPRITDEHSPVKFLKPDDSLLNTPNKITQNDFKGWVQERGLYFWSEYDSRYTPLLAMNDPGEKDLDGALLYTKLDKGTYIYTGVAFFRQLPEGVPGAYRLFVNLLSASRSH